MKDENIIVCFETNLIANIVYSQKSVFYEEHPYLLLSLRLTGKKKIQHYTSFISSLFTKLLNLIQYCCAN